MTKLDAPAVYVGTYAKYNAGSIAGEWLQVEDYADHDDFIAACLALHSDEEDPELMFQDYQCFPKAFYSESYIDPALWDWLALDDEERDILEAYQQGVDQAGDFETARDAYAGQYDSKVDWAASFLDDTGALESVPEWARNYFDYEAYARDAELGGDVAFVHHNGALYVFHTC